MERVASIATNMDSYSSYRDSGRSPNDRGGWNGRDDRVKDERDSFYRGRSPTGHSHGGRRSNRSRSPAQAVDRYEPRPSRIRDDYPPPRDRDRGDRGDREDRRRVTSPPANIDRYVPGQDTQPQQPLVNMIPDPMKLPYQVGFSYFGEWWRANEKIKEEKERQRTGRRREPERARGPKDIQEERDAEKAKIQAAYDTYKEELQAKMAQHFVKQHRDEQWFRERYIPEIRDPLRQQINEYRRGTYVQWEQDLESGLFDDFTLEGIPKSESDGQGGVIAKEEGEATAANEVLGVGDLVPAGNAEIRDENLYQPTLLIKTIAPSVSRQNLEAFCKEYLGDGEGGFKWLSLSDPNPSKRYHRIGWIMLHPAAEVAPVVDRAEAMEEDGELEPKTPVVVSTADKALEAINGKTVKDEVRGDFVCHVGVHNPPINPRKKALWDLFSAPERVEKDLALVKRLVNKFEEDFGSDFNAILKVEEKVDELRNAGKLQPAVPTSPITKKTKKERNLGMDVAMDEGEEPDIMLEDDEDEGMVDDEVDDESLLVAKKQLDLLNEYLRRVFNFCLYCVFESDSLHELTRKCPSGHLRRPRSTLSSTGMAVARASANGDPFPAKKRAETVELEEGETPQEEGRKFRGPSSKTEQQLQRAYNWVRTFEDKITQILDPDLVDIRKLGGKPVEDSVADELMKYVKQEDENKFRCKVPDCAKLFKEEHFWKKHVEKRHPEWLDKLKEEFNLINSYVMDPAHIAPSRTDANSNGHFPTPNGQTPTGTPRGFNLQNYTMNNLMAMPGFPGMPGGFPPGLFNAAAMQAGGPPAWNAPPGDDRSGTGPIRRGGPMGGNRYNNNRSGPYDRRNNNPRWGADGGAMMMGRGGRGGPGSYNAGGGRWGDGAGGGAAVGPREAIAGRTIKSYEDLDQVSGGGGGELNY